MLLWAAAPEVFHERLRANEILGRASDLGCIELEATVGRILVNDLTCVVRRREFYHNLGGGCDYIATDQTDSESEKEEQGSQAHNAVCFVW